jgi:hypothetical protein
MYKWYVDVKRFFVETGEVTRKGKPVKRPVVQRKLFVTGDPLVGVFRVFVYRRGGETRFSVTRPHKKQVPYWKQLVLTAAGQDEQKWTRHDVFTSEETLLTWLRKMLRDQAEGAVLELFSAMPESQAA